MRAGVDWTATMARLAVARRCGLTIDTVVVCRPNDQTSTFIAAQVEIHENASTSCGDDWRRDHSPLNSAKREQEDERKKSNREKRMSPQAFVECDITNRRVHNPVVGSNQKSSESQEQKHNPFHGLRMHSRDYFVEASFEKYHVVQAVGQRFWVRCGFHEAEKTSPKVPNH